MAALESAGAAALVAVAAQALQPSVAPTYSQASFAPNMQSPRLLFPQLWV